jgi:phosphoribosylamine--glycine ligase
MRILLVGDGAREHAIAKRLARGATLFSVMGRKNPGIASLSHSSFICPATAVEAIGTWAIQNRMELAFVTSETALQCGLTDALADAGIPLACPTSAGAVMGNNALYASGLMAAAKVRTPERRVCRNETDIRKALRNLGPVVVKPALRMEARGAMFSEMDFTSRDELASHCKALIRRHGAVVLERADKGHMFSLQAFSDGRELSAMPPVHVSFRRNEDEKGALTEGMGGFSSGALLPFMSRNDYDAARGSLAAIVDQLRRRGIDYRGALCGKFLVSGKSVKMLDINSTLGTVETICNLGSLWGDLAETLRSVAQGDLKHAAFDGTANVARFAVHPGYPRGRQKAEKIEIDERAVWDSGAGVLFESVERVEGSYVARGGRALAMAAKGDDLDEASRRVETALAAVRGNLRSRSDIGAWGKRRG